jgi:phosphoribosyl 1,2-cyclic phosphodiesterase
MSLKVKFWGVRGSIPSSESPAEWRLEVARNIRAFLLSGRNKPEQISDFLKKRPLPSVGGYGSATTCVQVSAGKSSLIIDCGSGLRRLGEQLMKGPAAAGKSVIHIYLTHFHWDHIIGLPFFAPLFIRGNQIRFYSVHSDLEELIRGKFRKPYFPVAFEHLASDIRFYQLKPRESVAIDEIEITPYQLDHPDPCWGLKVESGGTSYAHCVDTEGNRITRQSLGLDLPLYQNVDLMYFDAQYTLPELAEKANWGHSAAQLGLEIAMREHIPYVLFAHHDPGADKRQIQGLVRQTREFYDWKIRQAEQTHQPLSPVKWKFAYEGLQVNLFPREK